VADPPTGVAGHPLGHGCGSATIRPAGLVVAEPPKWPKGVARPPPVKEKKKKREGGRSTHRVWLATPRPWGWLGHHQTGRSGGGRATQMA
jgi:hypothetical protein